MAIPARALRALHDRLGRDAAESLADWMKQVDSTTADNQRLHEAVGALREEVRVSFAELDARMERRFAELLKWSFVFWVGAVGAIAALAGVLRR
jgi:hypothetical protein